MHASAPPPSNERFSSKETFGGGREVLDFHRRTLHGGRRGRFLLRRNPSSRVAHGLSADPEPGEVRRHPVMAGLVPICAKLRWHRNCLQQSSPWSFEQLSTFSGAHFRDLGKRRGRPDDGFQGIRQEASASPERGGGRLARGGRGRGGGRGRFRIRRGKNRPFGPLCPRSGAREGGARRSRLGRARDPWRATGRGAGSISIV